MLAWLSIGVRAQSTVDRRRQRIEGNRRREPLVDHVLRIRAERQLRTEHRTSARRGRPPAITRITNYTRTIDLNQPASRAFGPTQPPQVPGAPAPMPGNFNQNITPAQNNWTQQLEIWITPWGFLKGAAANNATMRQAGGTTRRVMVAGHESAVGSGLRRDRLHQRPEPRGEGRNARRPSDPRRHARRSASTPTTRISAA